MRALFSVAWVKIQVLYAYIHLIFYIQLSEVLFKDTTEEFTVRIARKPEEIKQLLEVGFKFVCEKDNLMFFRKRK